MKILIFIAIVLTAVAGNIIAQTPTSRNPTNKVISKAEQARKDAAAKEAEKIKREAELAAKKAAFDKEYAEYIKVIKNVATSDADKALAWKNVTDKVGVRFPGIAPKGLIWDKTAAAPKECEIVMPGNPISIDIGGGIKVDLVWCPSGTFMMGTAEGDREEMPAHEVTISSGFWIGKYEVTQEQWIKVMETNTSKNIGAKLPVESVPWTSVNYFIKKLNENLKDSANRHVIFHLPTEAEWEYACRAGTTTAFSFGDSEADLCQNGNYCDKSNTSGSMWQDPAHDDGKAMSAPVGSYKPNPWGIYDMHGNVYEWCQDWYDNYKAGPVTDPAGPATGQRRAYRGGSWVFTAAHCRSAARTKNFPSRANYDCGFRLLAR